jgi:hypothetical protein
MKIIITDWSKLSGNTQTILERFDINRHDDTIEIGEYIDIPYFQGYFTEDMAKEILEYQKSEESQDVYSARREGNTIFMTFHNRVYDD